MDVGGVGGEKLEVFLKCQLSVCFNSSLFWDSLTLSCYLIYNYHIMSCLWFSHYPADILGRFRDFSFMTFLKCSNIFTEYQYISFILTSWSFIKIPHKSSVIHQKSISRQKKIVVVLKYQISSHNSVSPVSPAEEEK